MDQFILQPRNDRPNRGEKGYDPWEPWYDACFEFVIAAESEQRAREIAQENAYEEARHFSLYKVKESPVETCWLDSDYSSCEKLSTDEERYYPLTKEGVISEEVKYA